MRFPQTLVEDSLLLQPHYNLVERDFERTLLPVADKWDLAVLPSGFLTGKYRAGGDAATGPDPAGRHAAADARGGRPPVGGHASGVSAGRLLAPDSGGRRWWSLRLGAGIAG